MSQIKLNVKSINGCGVTAYDQLFDTEKMKDVRASGTDTIFMFTEGREFVVEETFSEVQTLMSVLSVRIRDQWLRFDASAGKAAGSYDLVDSETGAAFELPAGAVVVDGVAIAKTTFTSATDAGTIALGIATDSAAGLKAAIAISNGANPWDASVRTALIPVNTAATYAAKTTAKRKIQAVVAVESLTAGVLDVLVRYIVIPA